MLCPLCRLCAIKAVAAPPPPPPTHKKCCFFCYFFQIKIGPHALPCVEYLYGTTFKHLPYCFGFNAPPPPNPGDKKKSDLDFSYFVKILLLESSKLELLTYFKMYSIGCSTTCSTLCRCCFLYCIAVASPAPLPPQKKIIKKNVFFLMFFFFFLDLDSLIKLTYQRAQI